MNTKLLQDEVQDFIAKNWKKDSISLLLKKPLFEGVSQQELVAQLECKKKAKDKLPSWFAQRDIIYPTKLNIEQASSEVTADYKAQLVSGNHLLDGSGGFGVDSLYLSKRVNKVLHCEIDKGLSECAAYNFDILRAKNIVTKVGDCLSLLSSMNTSFDWIYLDPSRRDTGNKKVFLLKDYQPNVIENLDILFGKTKKILLKTSPFLDISRGIEELNFVKEIRVVAVKNEVKELLWVLEYGFSEEVKIIAVNLTPPKKETFEFLLSEEKSSSVEFAKPQAFLYEPNTAILKSGAFKLVGTKHRLKKLAAHSHLYTSEKQVHFPGRIFEIIDVLPYAKKEIKKLRLQRANITTRNFPISVAELRKELRIADGGELYLFFTQTNEKNKLAIVSKKVDSSGVNPDKLKVF